jgi:hypothetical protein
MLLAITCNSLSLNIPAVLSPPSVLFPAICSAHLRAPPPPPCLSPSSVLLVSLFPLAVTAPPLLFLLLLSNRCRRIRSPGSPYFPPNLLKGNLHGSLLAIVSAESSESEETVYAMFPRNRFPSISPDRSFRDTIVRAETLTSLGTRVPNVLKIARSLDSPLSAF